MHGNMNMKLLRNLKKKSLLIWKYL